MSTKTKINSLKDTETYYLLIENISRFLSDTLVMYIKT